MKKSIGIKEMAANYLNVKIAESMCREEKESVRLTRTLAKAEKIEVDGKNANVLPSVSSLIDNWISIKELAAYLGVSVSFIQKYMNEGLPFTRWGRNVRFRIRDVEAWRNRRFL